MKSQKGVVRLLSGLVLFACMATPAAAISIGVVGSVDNLLGSTRMQSSGKATVEAWASSVLGFATSINYKVSPNAADWQLVMGGAEQDLWAHSLANEPAHYLLKLGVGNSGADTHYLYENLAALSWAVIDLSEMLNGQNLDFNFGRVSHIAEFDGTVDLSEPGSIGLLIIGLGLLSLLLAKKSSVL